MFFLLKRFRARLGHDRYSAATFDRLVHSMHVGDLHWIVNVTVWDAVFAIIVLAAILATEGVWANFSWVPATALLAGCGAVLAAVGGITAWCYQTGASRLGTIDLFACEITTLCRICTINGLADTCISAFAADTMSDKNKLVKMKEQFGDFESSETYTPFFDANAKELHSLSVKVLTNISAFYTYWKATRDAFRKLEKIQTNDGWHRTMCYVMFMQFLAFESARKAVRDLIEFEPNNAENTITILISELPLYRFLLDHFQNHFQKGDLRRARLELRLSRYVLVVPEVYYRTEVEHAKYKDVDTARKQLPHLAREEVEELCRDWEKAYEMLGELKRRYEAAIGEFPRQETLEPRVISSATVGQRRGRARANLLAR
jgi:hypothetical protein